VTERVVRELIVFGRRNKKCALVPTARAGPSSL